jgi:hypothetical protein
MNIGDRLAKNTILIPAPIENFLADFQAVITFFHRVLGNLNGVPPYLHHRNGDTRLPRQM